MVAQPQHAQPPYYLPRPKLKSKPPIIIAVVLVIVIVVIAAVLWLFVFIERGEEGEFFEAKATPTVALTSHKDVPNGRYIVSVSAPSRNDIAISAVRIEVTRGGTTLADRLIVEIYSKKLNDTMFIDNGDCLLNAGDSFYLYTTTYSEGDKLALIYIPSGCVMAEITLFG